VTTKNAANDFQRSARVASSMLNETSSRSGRVCDPQHPTRGHQRRGDFRAQKMLTLLSLKPYKRVLRVSKCQPLSSLVEMSIAVVFRPDWLSITAKAPTRGNASGCRAFRAVPATRRKPLPPRTIRTYLFPEQAMQNQALTPKLVTPSITQFVLQEIRCWRGGPRKTAS